METLANQPDAAPARERRTERLVKEGVEIRQVWELVEERPVSAESIAEAAIFEAVDTYRRELFEKHAGARDPRSDLAALILASIRPLLREDAFLPVGEPEPPQPREP